MRFKKSAAFTANANMNLTGSKREVHSLIQGVGDNFDQEICSQNGKLQTHSMALLMTRIAAAGVVIRRGSEDNSCHGWQV